MALRRILVVCAIIVATQGTDPGDDTVRWPSPAEFVGLQKRIQGDVFFPSTPEYIEGGEMKNTRFNSEFGLVVMVESREDVSEVIRLCEKYGIRPTVKSSGHDYIGRSAGNHTISINLKRLNKIKVMNDQRSATGVVAIVEPGNNWGDVYRDLHEHGYLVVGGNAHTVSPGGYTLGGGHSPMSRMFGLGVDNVIEFTLVTPNGSIITLTRNGGTIIKPGSESESEFEDPELFWSVLGGGGGTYGVVTSYTYKIHTPPAGGFCRFYALFPMTYGGQKVSRQILNYFSQFLLNNMTDNWGGYVLFSPHDGLEDPENPESKRIKGLLSFSLVHVGSCEEAKPQIEGLMAMYPEYRGIVAVQNYTTFWDYEKNTNDPTGFRAYIINRFIQRKDVENPGNLSSVLSDMVDAEVPIGGTWTLLGGQVTKAPRSFSSVSPAFRTSLGSLSLGTGWESAANDSQYITGMQKYAEKFYTIGEGVYINEPDSYIENWKEEYWGPEENYERLLATKLKYDPNHMFWCHHCAGSDLDRPVWRLYSSAGIKSSVNILAIVTLGLMVVFKNM